MRHGRRDRRVSAGAAGAAVVVLLALVGVRAQPGGRPQAPDSPASPQVVLKDKLGRDTPRGTLLGFIDAERKGLDEIAPLYLDTSLRDEAAVDLAHALYAVLDSRLPERLSELSDRPEGSLTNPLKPDQDVIGTIETANGPLALVLERVNRGTGPPIWLFSRQTLAVIPAVYEEVALASVDRYLPDILAKRRIVGIRLLGWLSLLLVVPLFYRLLGLVGPLFRPAVTAFHRRYGADDWPLHLLAEPLRLFGLAVLIRAIVGVLELPLRERQFWAVVETVLSTTAVAWLVLRLNVCGERYIRRRLHTSTLGEMAAMLRLVRRATDVLVVAIAVLAMLRYFGFDPTAALAGLGIGGIAVALAAQKTLENVIGGLSIVFDKAVRVGDVVKLGTMQGTVDTVGLRSTRIRTPDRTILSVPNGQIATANIETLSGRDKFWFHHIVSLRHDTTSAQMRAVVEGMRQLLAGSPQIDREAIGVRFFRLAPSSLDVEISAYVIGRDGDGFLEVQQDLLLRVMEIVEQAGTSIALPSQTLHLANPRAGVPESV